jgi:hypothetical protein
MSPSGSERQRALLLRSSIWSRLQPKKNAHGLQHVVTVVKEVSVTKKINRALAKLPAVDLAELSASTGSDSLLFEARG